MKKTTSANLGFEEKLWAAADKMRNNMDASEYKHVVLGLIFLKYISDSFEELHEKLKTDKLADPEDKDEYLAENVFWVPQEARWNFLLQNAKKAEIGKMVDDAMVAIEKENLSLKGVLPKDYARPTLDKQRLGELIDLVGTIGLGDKESRSKDILGRVYEYFIGKFASVEGKGGGEFYTPSSVVKLLVEMIEPYKGRVYDPCCGSGGMFVQSEKFIEDHGGTVGNLSIYGQESNNTTWKLCKMNLAIRGIEADIKYGNSFANDQLPDLKADFVLANPPFNDSDWGGENLKNDVRWKYGVPPSSNANYAWIQHFVYHLSPNGMAGFVMGNSSLSAERTGEIQVRKNLFDSDLVECILILPRNLFYNTSIPACLWFVSRNKKGGNGLRNREGEILFIDARNFGHMEDKTHRVITSDEIQTISSLFQKWRTGEDTYKDTPLLCKAVKIEEITKNSYNLSPNLYIDPEEKKKDIDFTKQLSIFVRELELATKERSIEAKKVSMNLSSIGYEQLSKCDFLNIDYKKLVEINNLIFNEWFENFHIPINTGYTITGFQSTGIKDIPRLPNGWLLKEFREVADVTDCLHSKKPKAVEDSKRILLEVNNISEFGLLDLSANYYISEEDYKKWTRNINVTGGDCVVTNTGRVGAVAQIPEGFTFAIGRNMTAIRNNTKFITPTYLINYLLSEYMAIQTYRYTDIGTILDSLNVKGVKKLLMVVPPIELLQMYENFAKPIRRLIEIGTSRVQAGEENY